MRSLLIVSLLISLCSCHVTENSLAGTYRLRDNSKTNLVVNRDKTFEFVKNFDAPGPLFFPDSAELNFRTKGNWRMDTDGKLILTSYNEPWSTAHLSSKDSVSGETEISSISFWDQYGDPVSIRLIRIPPDRTRLHTNNTISFFAQDFKGIDTMEFYFYGYPPYKWINKTGTSNRQYKITLYEQRRPGYFRNFELNVQRNKLVSTDRSFFLRKTK